MARHPIKICATCGVVKPVEEFGWRNAEKSLRASRCRPCERAHGREQYLKKKGDRVTRHYNRVKPRFDELEAANG